LGEAFFSGVGFGADEPALADGDTLACALLVGDGSLGASDGADGDALAACGGFTAWRTAIAVITAHAAIVQATTAIAHRWRGSPPMTGPVTEMESSVSCGGGGRADSTTVSVADAKDASTSIRDGGPSFS
jgi:hypothetical protein